MLLLRIHNLFLCLGFGIICVDLLSLSYVFLFKNELFGTLFGLFGVKDVWVSLLYLLRVLSGQLNCCPLNMVSIVPCQLRFLFYFGVLFLFISDMFLLHGVEHIFLYVSVVLIIFCISDFKRKFSRLKFSISLSALDNYIVSILTCSVKSLTMSLLSCRLSGMLIIVVSNMALSLVLVEIDKLVSDLDLRGLRWVMLSFSESIFSLYSVIIFLKVAIVLLYYYSSTPIGDDFSTKIKIYIFIWYHF